VSGLPRELPSRAFRSSESFLAEAREFGRRVRALRKARGWTLDKAAEHTGVDLKHIQMIEAGKLNVTLITMVRLSQGYGVRVGDLFESSRQAEDTREPFVTTLEE
jgi:transcriptional regulator with XRE-family HTH domain